MLQFIRIGDFLLVAPFLGWGAILIKYMLQISANIMLEEWIAGLRSRSA
ncbi:hypothetical protein [Janthinobacterium tructae]|nr:hypothetical protein [Janthinobacterium tructae]